MAEETRSYGKIDFEKGNTKKVWDSSYSARSVDTNKTSKWNYQSSKSDMLSNSYRQYLAARNRFLKSGGKQSDDFNRFDTPSTVFFRLFFYFDDGNLLDLKTNTDMLNGNYTAQSSEFANTAYNFLLTNMEYERAEYLKNFVYLLSNINTYSPWYFTGISGLGEALARKEMAGQSFKIEEERRSIEIKTLPDAYDTRIGTLLDLYRSAVFSWQLKTEIVPSNLRKFNMGILIFNAPVVNFSTFKNESTEYASMTYNEQANNYITSSKYIELLGCELIGLADTALQELDNKAGNQAEHSLVIQFDNSYEHRYNEFSGELITDIIEYDLAKERLSNDPKYYAYGSVMDAPGETFDANSKSEQHTMNTTRADILTTEYTPEKKNEKEKTLAQRIGAASEKLYENVKKTAEKKLEGFGKKLRFGNLADYASISSLQDNAQLLESNPLQAIQGGLGNGLSGDGISIGGYAVRPNSGWKKKNIETLQPGKKL